MTELREQENTACLLSPRQVPQPDFRSLGLGRGNPTSSHSPAVWPPGPPGRPGPPGPPGPPGQPWPPWLVLTCPLTMSYSSPICASVRPVVKNMEKMFLPNHESKPIRQGLAIKYFKCIWTLHKPDCLERSSFTEKKRLMEFWKKIVCWHLKKGFYIFSQVVKTINQQFQCKLRLTLLVKAKPTSFWLVYIRSKYTSIYFFMDFVFVLTFVKPTLTSIWLALTIASLEETLSEGVRRPQLWIFGQDEHLWRRWAFICASQLVRFKGKLDFQGNRDFQTLNLGFPGHFDRFWVFQK